MSDVPLFDPKKDYYAALKVNKDAGVEVIKAAHVKLALEHHPDLQKDKSSHASTADDFRKVSEAWAVLSKPELKKSYDLARAAAKAALHTTYNYTPGSSDNTTHSEVPLGSFTAQQSNYKNNVKAAAGFKTPDKYKTEKWQNMSLDKKKASRVKSVHTPASGLGIIAGLGMLCAIGYYSYSSTLKKRPKVRR